MNKYYMTMDDLSGLTILRIYFYIFIFYYNFITVTRLNSE
jgi:hypothetical protein